MNKRQFRSLKGWIDYERKYLPSLTDNQRIDYFEKRLNLVLLVPLEHMYRDLMKKGNRRSSPLLCFSTCICCAIEGLGKFSTGKTRSNGAGKRFRAFVASFMDPQFSNKKFNSKRYVDLLWDDFRNGLAHGFTIKHGGFEHCASYFQEKPIDGFKQLEIDPTHFFEDFKQAISEYLKRLRASSLSDTVRKHFNKAFTDLYIRGL